jgi:hypothetical protein
MLGEKEEGILFQFTVRRMLLFVIRESVFENGMPIVILIKRLFENYYGGKLIECFIPCHVQSISTY